MTGSFGEDVNSLTKVRILVSATFLITALFFIKSTSQYLPSLVTINLGEWETGYFSVHLDTGKGFRKAELYKHYFTSSSDNQNTLYFLLPSAEIKKLRVDPGNQKGKVSIKSICLHRAAGSRCWSPKSLEQDIFPMHDISKIELSEGALGLIVSGNDPYFTFKEALVFDVNGASGIYKFITIIVLITLTVIVFYLVPIFCRPRDSFDRAVEWIRQYTFEITLYQLSAITILFSLLTSGLWLDLDRLGPWFNLGLLLFLVYLAFKRLDAGGVFDFSP